MTDRKLVLAIDFDGVLHDPLNVEPGYRMGKPVQGAVEAMKALRQQGHTLWVHTARAASGGPGHVQDWLRYFGIPRDGVTDVKPNADVYLDDHAVRFTTWPTFMAMVNGGGL